MKRLLIYILMVCLLISGCSVGPTQMGLIHNKINPASDSLPSPGATLVSAQLEVEESSPLACLTSYLQNLFSLAPNVPFMGRTTEAELVDC